MPSGSGCWKYTAHAILQATVDDDLPELERAIQSIAASLPDDEADDRTQ
jgi:hypothetical protein